MFALSTAPTSTQPLGAIAGGGFVGAGVGWGGVFVERFIESLDRFDTATPQWEGELGEIPLPVSMPRRKAG